jgi:hypothetical protein
VPEGLWFPRPKLRGFGPGLAESYPSKDSLKVLDYSVVGEEAEFFFFFFSFKSCFNWETTKATKIDTIFIF